MTDKIKKIFFTILVAITVLAAKGVFAKQGPMITFRLDDGLMSQYNFALSILEKYGFPATAYIFTDPPQEGDWIGYMNWAQIEELHNVYGWEIGSHSKSHPDLRKLSTSQLVEELSGSKTILESHGFTVKSFASPFGYYNDKVVSYIARFYESHGSAWPYDFNSYPFSDYEISVQEVRGFTPVATVKSWIDEAVLNKKWLVLLFHEIVESNPGEYEYLKDNFEVVVDYVNTKNISVVTVSQALSLPGINLVQNPSFESTTGGWADNWLRTNTRYLSIDTNNNGSLPYPKNSLKISGSFIKSSVYTKDFLNINPNKKYLLKVYFNCQDFKSAGVNVFIDEYDSQGKRLNRKLQTSIWTKYVGSKTVIYTPSQTVAKILIGIESASDSNLTCYVDNIIFTDTGGETNKTPVLTMNIPDQSFDEDTILKNAFDLDNYFSDPDGDLLKYSYSGAKNVIVNINPDGTVNFSASPNWNGVENITFLASDGSLTAQDTITVTVNPVNDAPVINSVPVLAATPNTEYIYDIEATDVDGDILTYSLITFPSGMNINASTGLITWVPATEQIGNHSVTGEVSDGLLSNTQSWQVTVSEASSNLVLNPSFEALTGGWADNWLRTNITYISIDTQNNGSLPYPKNSLKFIGSASHYRVRTQDFIDINSAKTYFLKAYFNCQDFNSGGVDIFIDEYDSEGNWLSWKWGTGTWEKYVGTKSLLYTPGPKAQKLLIWIEPWPGSSLTCYLDNIVLEETP